DEGEREIGCACRLEEVLERMPDGRLNVLTRGTRPIRVLERTDALPYPAGEIEDLPDDPEDADAAAPAECPKAFAALVEPGPDERPEDEALGALDSYMMAGRVDFGSDAKQGLLELRSENARLRQLTRLLRAALRRLEWTDRAGARAASNGKVRFG